MSQTRIVNDNSAMGRIIRNRRLDLGMNITDLAEMAGCSRATLAKIEVGDTTPKVAILANIATALEMPIEYIIYADAQKSVHALNSLSKIETWAERISKESKIIRFDI